jgi:ketol-acid reductoisomerase
MYMSGEMARTFQTFADAGFYKSVNWHGAVAQYGGFLRTLELDGEGMRAHFASVLDDIRSGGFARKLQDEEASGYSTLQSIAAITEGNDPMSQAEERVRAALEG